MNEAIVNNQTRKTGSTLPFMGFERLISFRYLRPPKGEGFISVIAILTLMGIALGVTALIVVLSVMNGFRPCHRSAIWQTLHWI